MKVLLDVNLSPDWCEFLSRYDVEAIHWSEVGHTQAPDHEIIAYALEFGYIILTQDLDYGTILALTGAERPSVIQVRPGRVHPDNLGLRVAAALRHLETELHQGALITIERDRTRLKLLPIR